jgi:hypothetical protein
MTLGAADVDATVVEALVVAVVDVVGAGVALVGPAFSVTVATIPFSITNVNDAVGNFVSSQDKDIPILRRWRSHRRGELVANVNYDKEAYVPDDDSWQHLFECHVRIRLGEGGGLRRCSIRKIGKGDIRARFDTIWTSNVYPWVERCVLSWKTRDVRHGLDDC